MKDQVVSDLGRSGDPTPVPTVGRLVQLELRGQTEPVPSRVMSRSRSA